VDSDEAKLARGSGMFKRRHCSDAILSAWSLRAVAQGVVMWHFSGLRQLRPKTTPSRASY